jgi:DNA repair protein RadC
MAMAEWVGVPGAPGPVLWDAATAVEVVRRTLGARWRESSVVLVCDADDRLLTAVVVEGRAPPGGLERAVDVVARGAAGGGDALLVALARPGAPASPGPGDAERATACLAACRAHGLRLLDWLIVGDADHWSAAALAHPAGEEHHGHQ